MHRYELYKWTTQDFACGLRTLSKSRVEQKMEGWVHAFVDSETRVYGFSIVSPLVARFRFEHFKKPDKLLAVIREPGYRHFLRRLREVSVIVVRVTLGRSL